MEDKKKSFKILRIIGRLNIGGPAQNAILLTEGLTKLGYQTILVCGRAGSFEGDMMYWAFKKGIKPHVINELGREISFRDDLIAFLKIFRLICKERPDVIHTHTAKAGTLGRLAGIFYNLLNIFKHKKALLIHTFHGHVLHSYFGRLKTSFFILIEKMLALFTDKIIVVSGSLKKELVERFQIAPEKKFTVIELGLELDELFELPQRNNSNCINIGIVGRLTPIKNHRMLFRTANKLRLNNVVQKTIYTVIGEGELRQDLENYAKELNIEDIVRFMGWVKDSSNIYRELDIVVLTSLNEGTPVSIIEAMAAGRPVVATNVGGVSDLVDNEKSGYLVESDNEGIFADRLRDLIMNQEKRNKFGVKAKELAKNRFSKERLLKDTEKLYNTCLKLEGIVR